MILKLDPIERNTEAVINSRYEYANWLMSFDVLDAYKFYIDEFGCNMYTRRSQGRSQSGARATRIAPTQQCSNITVCNAVSPTDGMVSYEVIEGAMTKDRFRNFLQVCGKYHTAAGKFTRRVLHF